jgi:hypothetical protein
MKKPGTVRTGYFRFPNLPGLRNPEGFSNGLHVRRGQLGAEVLAVEAGNVGH